MHAAHQRGEREDLRVPLVLAPPPRHHQKYENISNKALISKLYSTNYKVLAAPAGHHHQPLRHLQAHCCPQPSVPPQPDQAETETQV